MPIDKSVLTLGEPRRLRDPAYRKSANGRRCQVEDCHDHETTVLAHIRLNNAGTGLKPPDDESVFLCSNHPNEFDTITQQAWLGHDASRWSMEWLVRHILLPQRRTAYRQWKQRQDGINAALKGMG